MYSISKKELKWILRLRNDLLIQTEQPVEARLHRTQGIIQFNNQLEKGLTCVGSTKETEFQELLDQK